MILELETFYLTPIALLIVITGIVSWKDYSDGNTDFLGWKVILAPFVIPVQAFISLKALIELYITWEGEWYRVRKTTAEKEK